METLEGRANDAERSRRRALSEFMRGDLRSSIALYERHMARFPADLLAQHELTAFKMLRLKRNDAAQKIKSAISESIPSDIEARYRTVKAYLEIDAGNLQEGVAELKRAEELAPDFVLPALSLGRYHLITRKDPGRARPYLGRANELFPDSLGTGLMLVSLAAQEKDYPEARLISNDLTKRFRISLSAWISYLWSSLLSAPAMGSIGLILVAFLMFVPYVGVVVLGVGVAASIVSYMLLRRFSFYMAILPLILTASYSVVYLMRAIILGHLFP
jgi:tetratricopeptide (TPR) repeat protein